MELYERDFFIARIRAGYIPICVDGKKLIIHHPNKHILLRASEIYLEAYQTAVYEELFDDDDIYVLLKAIGIWSEQKEKELEKIVPDHIEYWKIELYNNLLKSNTRNTIRKYLEAAKKELLNLHRVRRSLDHMTCAGYASYVKNMYIISQCTRHNKKKVNWNNFDLNRVMGLYYENTIDSDTIRNLAHNLPWSGMWSTLKVNGHIFDNIDLTSEQQTLISWSTMYDRIYESPDCPPDDVIKDDDMLDGWLLIQRRQRDVDKKKREVQGTLSNKIGNADEVYIIAETPSDAQTIDLLNDQHALKIKEQKFKEIKEQGTLQEQQLSDVKRKRSMQLQQAYVNQIKGR